MRDRVAIVVNEIDVADDHHFHDGLTAIEVVEVLTNAPQFFVNPPSRTRGGPYYMLGPLKNGRFVKVPLAPTGVEGRWHALTAHYLHERYALRHYER